MLRDKQIKYKYSSSLTYHGFSTHTVYYCCNVARNACCLLLAAESWSFSRIFPSVEISQGVALPPELLFEHTK